MRIITDSLIDSLQIDSLTSVQWVKEAFLLKDKALLPPKISLHPQGSDFINTMPCLLPNHRFGCKVVSRIEGSSPSLKSNMLLIDSRSGELLAILESNLITAMRTAAVATLAIQKLKNQDAQIFSFLGLGVIGQTTIRFLIENLPKDNFEFRFLKYKNQAEALVKGLKDDYKHINFNVVNSVEELCINADVITSAISYTDKMIVPDTSILKEGVLIVPIHTRGFQNCDKIFDRVVADDTGHVQDFQYFPYFKDFCELSEVLSSKKPGRKSKKERILSYNIGLGLHDVFYASQIYDWIIQGKK